MIKIKKYFFNNISLEILVEGIEHLEQLDALKVCNGPGFYFYHPMLPKDVTQLLHPLKTAQS